MDKEKIFKQIPVFKNLQDSIIEKLSAISIAKNFKANETLFFQGDKPSGFYALVEGKIKIYKLSFNGKEQIIRIIDKKSIFGEAAIFINENHPVYASAIEKSELLFFPAQEIILLMRAEPDFSFNMIKFLSKRLIKLTSIIESVALTEVPARIANYIIGLGENNNCPKKCFLKVNRRQLASIIGTIPETLSRTLKKMKENGIINISGNEIVVENQDKLVALSKNEFKL